MVTVLVSIVVFCLFSLLWPVFAADEPQTIRDLTPDEKAAWGLYRISDKSRVARMKSTRAQDRQAWDARYQWILRGKAMGLWYEGEPTL